MATTGCNPSFDGIFEISPDGGTTFYRVHDVLAFTINPTLDERECTSKDTGGERVFHPNRRSATADISCNWLPFDPGQQAMLVALMTGTEFLARFRLQEEEGAPLFTAEAYPTGLPIASPEDGNNTLGGSLRLNYLTAGFQDGVNDIPGV